MHIAVAGAGIGGLTAALALARVGATVTVLERRPALAEFGAGLQLSPNATRILDSLGLLAGLRAAALEPHAVRVRRGRDGADLVRFPLGSYAVERYGAPFLLILRPQLQRLLADAVLACPTIRLRFAADVRRASPDNTTSVLLETAVGRLNCDGFVDARGLGAAWARRTGRVAWRALVPATQTAPEHRRPETTLWLGSQAHLVHYPVPEGDRINVVAVTQERAEPDDADDDLWSKPGEPDVLRRAFVDWHPLAVSLLDRDAGWRRWPLFDAVPRSRWTDGSMTVLGDAAHPMLPFLAQGASQAIEDAACLAACLSAESDVPAAFAAYEALRRGRATRVQDASRRQADVYHLGRPAADVRDLAMRLLGGRRALGRMDWLYGAG